MGTGDESAVLVWILGLALIEIRGDRFGGPPCSLMKASGLGVRVRSTDNGGCSILSADNHQVYMGAIGIGTYGYLRVSNVYDPEEAKEQAGSQAHAKQNALSRNKSQENAQDSYKSGLCARKIVWNFSYA